MKITDVKAYEVLDSRGNPTVATKVTVEGKSVGFAISPSGASTGIHEAHELRDNDENRYNGKGVLTAVQNVNGIIAKDIIGTDFENQSELDKTLKKIDGTENKEKMGANAILSVSLAFAKASAKYAGLPLYKYLNGGKHSLSIPRPMMNILNGGAHSSNNVDIQEFMVIPCFKSEFSEKLRVCTEIYHKLGEIIKKKGYSSGVGDEGGYSPELKSDEEAIELILSAVNDSGYSDKEIKIGLDIASSEWYQNGMYVKPKSNQKYTPEELTQYYEKLVKAYPVISIEDPFAEDDFDNFKLLTEKTGDKVQIVGDDLFVTNIKRLETGIEQKLGNSILIKPNQIGTLSETMEVIEKAKASGFKTIISHRSGETEDTTIADIGVGLDVGQIKTGAPCRTERVCKYNRLLIIEKEICC